MTSCVYREVASQWLDRLDAMMYLRNHSLYIIARCNGLMDTADNIDKKRHWDVSNIREIMFEL